MIPEIYAEMSIVFENDFDVSVISKLLNISPHEFQSQSNDTKVSPITNKKLEGFWTIRSDIFHEFDLKVATDNLIHPVDAILREMSLLDSEERFKKAFLYLCAVGTGITEFETDGINQEDIENIRSKNGTGYYTRICLDEGIIDARMNSDSRYCFIMGEPEEGLAKYFENTEALADVFSLFSDKDILKIIFFMYSRQNFPVALSVIASKTGIAETKVEALMEKLCAHHLAYCMIIETEQGNIKTYTFYNETVVIPLLCFAREIANYDFINWSSWFDRHQPLF